MCSKRHEPGDSQKRSGDYTKFLPERALYNLCHTYETAGKISREAILTQLRVAWPKHKPITKQDVFYTRVKCLRLLPLIRETKDFEEFSKKAQESKLLGGIDDEIDVNDDEAYELAHSACAELLEKKTVDSESIFSVVEFLKLLSAKAKGFSYEVIHETHDGKKEMLGILWMTATMRQNYELFGEYI